MTCAPSVPIRYVDLAGQHSPLKAEILAAVGRVIDHGQFVLGPEVAEFERQMAKLCGTRFAVGVANGTDALILALRALGVGPGDEVITVPNSFVASTSCIRLVGARPVFVDVRDDYTIDPALAAQAVTARTKALLPVHLTGRPCDIDPLIDIAREYNLAVVEDCAQAVGARYRGQPVGSFGNAGCFSLHPLKTLNALGDAGVITTSDPELHERLRLLRNIGLKTRDDCTTWSGNSRLDTLQAAILLVKLGYLEQWTARRRENATLYRRLLAPINGIHLPHDAPGCESVYHTLVVQARQRDALREHLAARGIETAIHYPVPIHLSTAGRELGYPPGSFPVAERHAGQIVSLPVHHALTADQIERVCSEIGEFYSGGYPQHEVRNAGQLLVSRSAVR